jgi:inner membrane protein
VTKATHVEFGYSTAIVTATLVSADTVIEVLGFNWSLFGVEVNVVATLVALGIGCYLPDIDHSKTKANRYLSNVRRFLRFIYFVVSLLTVASIVFNNTILISAVLVVVGGFVLDVMFGRLRHRGIMHSIWIPLLCVILAYLFSFVGTKDSTVVVGLLVGVSAGYLLHLIADMFTVDGVRLFQPFCNIAFGLPLVSTGGDSEVIFRAVVRCITVIVVVCVVVLKIL